MQRLSRISSKHPVQMLLKLGLTGFTDKISSRLSAIRLPTLALRGENRWNGSSWFIQLPTEPHTIERIANMSSISMVAESRTLTKFHVLILPSSTGKGQDVDGTGRTPHWFGARSKFNVVRREGSNIYNQ